MPLSSLTLYEKKVAKIASTTQQGCYIIISKLSYDSSYLSLWPWKVGEEFLNPRTSCSTESSQFPGFLLVKAHRHVFRKVLEEFFKAENEFPASSSPPMGLQQGGPGLQPHNPQSIHTGEIFRWWDNFIVMHCNFCVNDPVKYNAEESCISV